MALRKWVFGSVAALALAVPSLSPATAYFDQTQLMYIANDYWAYAGVWNYNYGSWDVTAQDAGSFSYYYYLPYNAWQGHFVYDYDSGRWEEAVYIYDQNL